MQLDADRVLVRMVQNIKATMEEAAMPGHSNGWALEKEKANVCLYTRDQDRTNTPAVKVVALFDVPAEFVYMQLINPELSFDSSSSRKPSETVEYYAPDCIDPQLEFGASDSTVNLIQVVHSFLPLPLVSDRDFVCAEFYGCIDGRYTYTASSVEHPLCPTTRKYVRGNISLGGWVIDPIDPTSCQVHQPSP
eukprot:TRINITY_DN9323_c0_g1_i3.p1 TRINITY_DN9323_c0_g1~~TRINITY_DN9323_c0_g1_i3.p1  ORF type:complete len:192 (-),score=52.74 TRINITY_DN9323_c0_g1_i3:70-645(-)